MLYSFLYVQDHEHSGSLQVLEHKLLDLKWIKWELKDYAHLQV